MLQDRCSCRRHCQRDQRRSRLGPSDEHCQKNLDWEEMFRLSIDPEKARRYRAQAKPEKEDTCSMCGNFCAVKNMNRILEGEIVSIYDE